MNKRQFLAASGALAAMPFASATPAAKHASPVILTVSGAISRHNRGALDQGIDLLLHKHKVTFDKAYTFDFGALSALHAVTIHPTLEEDEKQHKLSGPLLTDVLNLVGANMADTTTVFLRAVDGYTVAPTIADIRRYNIILATHMDDAPMSLGGLGPIFAIYDADNIPELAKKPLNERFGLSPWALYHIEIKAT